MASWKYRLLFRLSAVRGGSHARRFFLYLVCPWSSTCQTGCRIEDRVLIAQNECGDDLGDSEKGFNINVPVLHKIVRFAKGEGANAKS